MAKFKQMPPLDFMRQCFVHDEATGILYWRRRPEAHFASERAAKTWNARFAGAEIRKTVAGGYLSCQVTYEGDARALRAHRVVFLLANSYEPPEIDHVDTNRLNNRPSNLRAASRKENRRNSIGRHKRGLPKGVHVDTERGGYIASATIDRKRRFIGRFANKDDAHAAYCAFVKPLYGEFFRAGPEHG